MCTKRCGHGVPCATSRLAAGDAGDVPQYPIYPEGLKSPYRERRFAAGEQLYAALGITREDRGARRNRFSRNWEFFGAPVGLFCYVDRDMGSAQWADLGMYLQTIMLLRAEGLASCAQEAWSVYHETVDETVQPSDGLMLFCGMAIGYERTGVVGADVLIDRAPLSETVRFLV